MQTCAGFGHRHRAVSFAIYFIESFAALPRTFVAVFVVLYMAWMLFAYFILGPKVLAKEKRRLTDIINELESISQELTERMSFWQRTFSLIQKMWETK